MIKTLALILSFLCCHTAWCQYPGYVLLSQPDSFKRSFSVSTASTSSIQCDFTQEKTLTMLSEKISSAGKFWFQKKDKLRMEYTRPFNYLLILESGKIFIKDGQKENKVSAGSSKVFQQVDRILIDCVSGNMLGNNDFQYRIFESANTFLIELKPIAKNLTALYKNINIVMDKKDYSVTSIEMSEVSGDNTIIHFQNRIINAHIPDSVFFIP
jgi:outer membrane lipoprotein-sorting protein